MITYNKIFNSLRSSDKDFELSENEIELSEMPNFEYDEWSDIENKFITNETKKHEHLLNKVIEKIKTEQGNEIENSTFTHDNKLFSCGLISQTNYMGLKTAIDAEIVTYPAKCWSTNGEEYIIDSELTLKTMIGKLFSAVYPIREKANIDEQIARNSSIEELEGMLI